jgi:glutaminase
VNEWKYDHCKVLNPSLDRLEMDNYIKALLSLDNDKTGNFLKSSTEKIKESGLYYGQGDFDIMFTFLSIKRELSTLRIAKKRKTDNIEVIK